MIWALKTTTQSSYQQWSRTTIRGHLVRSRPSQHGSIADICTQTMVQMRQISNRGIKD